MINFDDDIEQCLQVLRSGGIILYPTDTIWGIGCDATQPKAVKKIYELKQRPAYQSMIVLLAAERDINYYVTQADPAVFDYLLETTKPTTVIYEGATGVADELISDDGTLAIRITRDEFCKTLIKRLRQPIVSTSANLAGEPSPLNFNEINDAIKNGVDYIVQHRQNDLSMQPASSIIRWDKSGKPFTVRA